MKTDIKEKKDEYVIDIDLPGYEKEGIKLNIEPILLMSNSSTNKTFIEPKRLFQFLFKFQTSRIIYFI